MHKTVTSRSRAWAPGTNSAHSSRIHALHEPFIKNPQLCKCLPAPVSWYHYQYQNPSTGVLGQPGPISCALAQVHPHHLEKVFSVNGNQAPCQKPGETILFVEITPGNASVR